MPSVKKIKIFRLLLPTAGWVQLIVLQIARAIFNNAVAFLLLDGVHELPEKEAEPLTH